MKLQDARSSSRNAARDRAARPILEGLEGRLLLYATTGDHFTYGSRITWSIVPDGTNLGGVTSNLNATLNSRFGAGNWQRALQDAFAVWENVANVNFVPVSDDGSPTNSGGYQQGSPTVGDIRISGFSQNLGVLAFTILPPPANGGSDAGDIFLNSAQAWQIGSNYDLETTLIHEIGHSLGLGHSSVAGAAMTTYYSGVQEYLSNDDVAGVQSIWGARQYDGFTLGNGNFIWQNAADVSNFRNAQNQLVLGPLNVVSPADSYWFKVTTPSNASSNFSVVVQSTNLSELSPKVQVYDAGLHGLVQNAASANSYGATIGVTVGNATPNTTYYIKVSGSNNGPTGNGSYGLLVNMGYYNPPLVAPPYTQVAAQADQGGGSTNQTAAGDLSIITLSASADLVDSLTVAPTTHINGPLGRIVLVPIDPSLLLGFLSTITTKTNPRLTILNQVHPVGPL